MSDNRKKIDQMQWLLDRVGADANWDEERKERVLLELLAEKCSFESFDAFLEQQSG